MTTAAALLRWGRGGLKPGDYAISLAAWDAALEIGRTERQIYDDDGVCRRCGRPKPWRR